VELERSGRLAGPTWLLPPGAASYSIYLSHVVAASALMWGAIQLNGGALGAEAMALLLAAAGIAGDFAYHFVVERPTLRVVRGWLGYAAPRRLELKPIPVGATGI
jgi:peptidoglycan/LPS O-acetylase OafA/YrhL